MRVVPFVAIALLLASAFLPAAPASSKTPYIFGRYDSNWGEVILWQKGDRIYGTYECCEGGTISGTIQGDEIHYEWVQPGAKGRGSWKIYDSGNVLDGPWGFDAAEAGGGDWNLFRHGNVT